MEQTRLSAETREGKGRGFANALRRNGSIPAIIYGHKIEPLPIHLQEKALRRVLSSGGENVIINMDLVGKDSPETVIIKEVQVDPVSRRILHADFMRVSLDELITTHVPVTLHGTPQGISEGGILEFLHREVALECQAGKIPEYLSVDISSLKIGDQIRVGDLIVDEGMRILDDPATTIVAIGTPTVHKEEAAAPTEVEDAEPEVIEKRRKEEEEEEK
ncbi:50S ribosomal protein L25 [Candidatus Poribacteria bacterium]|nr:50S ribosomal protein L25 [Candidatus Poribacteria bacterium]